MASNPTPKISHEAVELANNVLLGYTETGDLEAETARAALDALEEAYPAIRSSVLEEIREELIGKAAHKPVEEIARVVARYRFNGRSWSTLPRANQHECRQIARSVLSRSVVAALDKMASEGGER